MHSQEAHSLAEYLDAMFHYYEAQGVATKGNQDLAIGEEATGGDAPIANKPIGYRSLFEVILAKFGLNLSDASFNEIISGDYYSVLARHGLISHEAINNASFQGLGGVV